MWCCWLLLFFYTGGFYISGILFLATGTPPWLLRPVKASTSSELYPGYFRLLYFCQVFSSQFYRKRYGFEWAFFIRKRFLPYAPFSHFGTFLWLRSRIFLYACPHRVVPSGWRMDLNYSYCRYKTIDLLWATKDIGKTSLLLKTALYCF